MKRGITAISVSIMIVIIIVLLGTITISSHNILQNAKKIVFSLELSNIQEKVDKYMKTAADNDYPITTETYSLSISSISTSVKTQFDGEVINNNNVILYELDLSEINIEDNEYGNKKTVKDVYVFSKDTGRVYYLEGVKFKGNTYFTLTKELIDINEKNKKEKNDDASSQPISITADSFIIKALSSGDKEIYIPNIKAEGKNINVVKYELGIIEKNDAKEYFKTNGKTLINDRLKMSEISDVTIYAENSKGDYAIKHIYNIIPEKFSMSIYPGEMSIEDGLVIYDIPSLEGIDQETAMTSYNQFVWVPVPDMSNFKKLDGYSSGNKQNLLGPITEPFSKTTSDGITLSLSNDLTLEYSEFAAMKTSVEKYGGFYIARYEAGKENINGVDTLVSKKGVSAWSSIAWGDSMVSVGTTGAVAKSRGMYDDSYSIKSHLIYGVQWDAIMTFISTNYPEYIIDSSGAGHYMKDKDGNQISNVYEIKCGTVDEYSRNNIFDMAGNVFEWTMEAAYTHSRVRRGGSWAFDGYATPVSSRNIAEPTYTSGSCFRPALYLK